MFKGLQSSYTIQSWFSLYTIFSIKLFMFRWTIYSQTNYCSLHFLSLTQAYYRAVDAWSYQFVSGVTHQILNLISKQVLKLLIIRNFLKVLLKRNELSNRFVWLIHNLIFLSSVLCLTCIWSGVLAAFSLSSWPPMHAVLYFLEFEMSFVASIG
jgi:hypothetical protein